jgi:hypothetical protein
MGQVLKLEYLLRNSKLWVLLAPGVISRVWVIVFLRHRDIY